MGRTATNRPKDRSGQRLPAVAATSLLLFGIAACVGLQPNPNVVGTYSDKLSTYNYREEGTLSLMVVGVDAARFIRKEPFFPLFVQVANKSKLTFDVTRESFILEDSVGRQYGAVPPEEMAGKYARQDIDRRMFVQNRSITSSYMGLYTYVTSNFYPSSSRHALIVDQLSLPPRSFMEDVLYFPIPETGPNGVPLRLLFRVKGLADPIQVVFEIPKTLGILEKDDQEQTEGGSKP